MTSTTITFRVDAAEHAEMAARAARDKISLSDYVRVRLGLRPSQNDDNGAVNGAEDGGVHALLADHGRRLDALEAGRTAATAV
jgi:hypothetical protein